MLYRLQISTTKQAARGFGLRFGKSCYFPAFYEGARFLFKFPHFFCFKNVLSPKIIVNMLSHFQLISNKTQILSTSAK